MKFSQYFNSCKGEHRESIFRVLGAHGDFNQMLSYIDQMPSFSAGKRDEITISIDEHYFIEYGPNRFRFLPTSNILYCYHSVAVMGSHHVIGLVAVTGIEEFFVRDPIQHARVFDYLTKYIGGFDTRLPADAEFTVFPDGFSGPFEWKITVSPSEFALWKMSKKPFQKNAPLEKTYKVNIAPISNIIWCKQVENIGGENTDSFGLELYLADGTRQDVWVFSDRNHAAARKLVFDLALHIKKNVPHLLYGPNEEYARLFQDHPMKLYQYALAKGNH